jgi:acetyltransferase-like isoleucine patch superfamily enzyme
VSETLRRVRSQLGSLRARREMLSRNPGATIHRSVVVRSPERLTVGSGSTVDANTLLHCGGLDWSPEDGRISIGGNCYVGPNCVLFGAAGIEIADATLIGPGVVITSHQHTFADRGLDIREQPIEFAPVVIERNSWLGANATILPGIRVGVGSVVGAGAVVTHDVPPWTVVHGVPARVHRAR